MKQQLLKILFCILALAFLLGMFVLAETIAKVLTIKTIVNVAYIMLAISFIYLLKN